MFRAFKSNSVFVFVVGSDGRVESHGVVYVYTWYYHSDYYIYVPGPIHHPLCESGGIMALVLVFCDLWGSRLTHS